MFLFGKLYFTLSSVRQILYSSSLPPVDMRYVTYIQGHYFSQACKRIFYIVVLCSTYLKATLLHNQNYKHYGVVTRFYDDSFVYRFQWYEMFPRSVQCSLLWKSLYCIAFSSYKNASLRPIWNRLLLSITIREFRLNLILKVYIKIFCMYLILAKYKTKFTRT